MFPADLILRWMDEWTDENLQANFKRHRNESKKRSHTRARFFQNMELRK